MSGKCQKRTIFYYIRKMEEIKNNKSREVDLSSFLLFKICDTLISDMRILEECINKVNDALAELKLYL